VELKDDKWEISRIADATEKRQLMPNPEYQRGLAWKRKQKVKFIDSIFRGYPIPPLILHERVETDAYGTVFRVHEIIDGQQRVNALVAYRGSQWEVPAPNSRGFPLPKGVVDSNPAPAWSRRRYSDLPVDVKAKFNSRKLDVLLVTSASHPDEVRDLFIRLQGGTALTRQQVRDAWPGPIAKYLEAVAGRVVGDHKLEPRFRIFAWVGRWGRRLPEGADPDEDVYHDERQTAAQVLRIYLERESLPPDGGSPPMPSLSAESLDEMYHTRTDWDSGSPSADRFERLLKLTEEAITGEAPPNQQYIRKSMLFSTFCYFEDLTRHPQAAVNAPLVSAVGKAFWSPDDELEPDGPVSSSEFLLKHYRWFTDRRTSGLSISWLDPHRAFPESMKEELWKTAQAQSAGGIPVCPVCGIPIARGEADFDHRKPWILGGPTSLQNGRVLHQKCNRAAGGGLSGVAR
jgi:hypothetical protein